MTPAAAPKVFVNDDDDGARGIIEAALRERGGRVLGL
jgi:hypothetical protein